jgi:two-component system, LytTR family, response regulator AlgR
VSTPLRLMIVDDEVPARVRLRNLLDDLAPTLPTEVVVEAGDGVEALEKLVSATVDVALIDIRMPRMDGVELARQLGRLQPAPVVIFVTAYEQYAVTAFDLSALDYLLKPVRAERLGEALRKVAGAPASTAVIDRVAEQLAPGGRRHLRCSERGRILLVPVAEILYLKAEMKYVTARTGEREFLLEESLAQLETEFGGRFLRIHRNCLVARAAVAGFVREHDAIDSEGEGHWLLLLRGIDDRLAVSRRQWPQVKAVLEG